MVVLSSWLGSRGLLIIGRILVTIGVSCRLSYAMLHQETHIASVTLPIAGGYCLVVGATVLLVARTYSTSLRVDSSAMGQLVAC